MSAQAFPDRFVWGAATAAYQVEGGARTGGRGLSIWDMLCEKAGAIHGGHNGEVSSDLYDRLVDELLASNITPYVTLFHWDLPLDLYHRGGWLNRDVARWFADYTELCVRKLGDRVEHWMTLNEPQVFVGHGHYDGRHAPGLKFSLGEMLRCGHHALLAHGLGVQAIRAASP